MTNTAFEMQSRSAAQSVKFIEKIEQIEYDSKQNFFFLKELTEHLRLLSKHPMLQGQEVFIPDECEYMGLLEGYYELSGFLHFIADMIEP